MTRFLCTGDLHLGAGSDYGREPGDRLRDQERVWARVLELAAEHDVDAVLFAGDAFHRRRPTPAEMIAFQRPLQAFAAEHDIEVVAIVGNHDCEAAHLPTALDVFGREVDLYAQPGVWLAPDRGAAVACLPWSPVARLVATRNGGDRDELNREAAGLLVAAARGLRAQIPAEQPAVLMGHWHVNSATTVSGRGAPEIFTHEPLLDYSALEELGFDAIVLGHNHMPQMLGQSGFHVSSPSPVNFGEGESPHGCWLLDLGEGRSGATFLPVESRPFVTLALEPGDGDAGMLWPEMWDGSLEGAVVRIRYQATEEQARRVDQAALRDALYRSGAHKVFAILADVIRESRARVAGVDEDLAPLSALDLWLEAEQLNGWQGDALRALTAGYLEAVGS